MPVRQTVLFLPHPYDTSLFKPWGEDVLAAIGDRHSVRVFDYHQPIVPQFSDVDVVIDHGGVEDGGVFIEAAQSVRLWQILGQGTDHFALDLWRASHIPVANCPGQFSATALAECAMMFILMLTRGYPTARANLERGVMYQPLGIELAELKLAIIGFGASGRELARRARPFGMHISAIDTREISRDEFAEYQLAYAGKPVDMSRVVAEADVISLHLHLTEKTRHIIDARCLSLMRPTALLINVARGALVDETALAQALLEGRIGGAGLDVFSQEPPDMSSPIFRLPNVVTTPHIAGVTDRTSRYRARCAAENVDRIAAGLEPLYRVA